MAVYYLWSGATGSATGADWTNAFTTFGAAVSAATTNGDQIRVAHDHNENIGSSAVTWTLLANISVVCTNRSTGAATTGAIIRNSGNNSMNLRGAVQAFIHGIQWRRESGTGNISLEQDGARWEFSSCIFNRTGASASSHVSVGSASNGAASWTKLTNCTLISDNASHSQFFRRHVEIENLSVSGTPPSVLFGATRATTVRILGSDLSLVTGTLVENHGNSSPTFVFDRCRFGSGVVPVAAPNNMASARVFLHDCAVGDQHYNFQYTDARGSLTVDTSIYANDGASYDGTNRASWKIVTTAQCSFFAPFVTPWFSRYHDGADNITPQIEILRDGNASAWRDDQVWAEWMAKTSSGSTLGTIYSDRMADLLGTPSDQDAGVGLGGWTGKSGTAWSGRLQPTSGFTPNEIGHLSARILVGVPSTTVYVDPTIRGVSG